MAVQDRVSIELYVDDQGTIKIVNCTKAVQDLGAAGKQSFAGSSAAADDFASALAKQLGIYALVTAAAYKLEQAVIGSFKAGIKTIDDYQIAVISIAATLTDMAKPGQGDMRELFQRNQASAEGMWRAINVEAARHFAGVHEGMMVYNRLVQSGYAVRLDEVGALMTLTDKIKLATQGQNQEVQLNQEVRALMEGQLRNGSLLALELQSRIGPEWSSLLDKHKQAGDLLQWLISLWPGLEAATGRITETLTSQSTTLKSILQLIAIDGMQGIYQDIVGLMKEGNDYLRENERLISNKIIAGWVTVKYYVGKIRDDIDWINQNSSANIPNAPQDRTLGQTAAVAFKESFDPLNWANALLTTTKFLWDGIWEGTERAGQSYMDLVGKTQMVFGWIEKTAHLIEDSSFWHWAVDVEGLKADVQWLENKVSWLVDIFSRPFTWVINVSVSGLPTWLGGSSGSTTPVLPKNYTIPDTSLARQIEDAQLKAQGIYRMQFPGIGLTEVHSVPFAPPAIENRRKSEDGGAGRSTEGAENRLASLMAQLDQEFAQLTQGKEAALGGWVEKEMTLLDQLAAKGLDVSEARVAVWRNSAAKLGKIDEDFNLKFANGNEGAFQKLNDQYAKDLRDWGTTEGKKDTIYNDYRKKWLDTEDKFQAEWLGMQKSSLDGLAQTTPVLSEQAALKMKALDIEARLKQAQDEKKLRELQLNYIISEGQAQEMRGLLALEAAQKRFNLEMESNRGLEGWAWARAKEADQHGTLKDMLGGLESGFENAFSSGLQGVLAHDQQSLKKIGATMFQGLIGEINKRSITSLFDSAAGMLRPQGPQGLAGAAGVGGNTAGQLNQAARSLQQSGQLGIRAGLGFNLNTAQFGLAAGGLLLSGLGITTNSQALVMAGTILQVAGMAIQLYQALTATSAMTEFTLAATALTGSAVALDAAASMLMVAAGMDALPFFHIGGVVAHRGLIVAHDGLNLRSNERFAKLLVDEWVLNPDATASLSRIPGAFDMLNSGRLPVLASPVPDPAGDFGGGTPKTIVHAPVNAPISITIQPRQEMTQADYDKHIGMIKNALNKHILGPHGQELIGDKRY